MLDVSLCERALESSRNRPDHDPLRTPKDDRCPSLAQVQYAVTAGASCDISSFFTRSTSPEKSPIPSPRPLHSLHSHHTPTSPFEHTSCRVDAPVAVHRRGLMPREILTPGCRGLVQKTRRMRVVPVGASTVTMKRLWRRRLRRRQRHSNTKWSHDRRLRPAQPHQRHRKTRRSPCPSPGASNGSARLFRLSLRVRPHRRTLSSVLCAQG